MENLRTICPGCHTSIDPIFIVERSPRSKRPYLITKCPRERCGFNLDIEDYTGQRKKRASDKPKDNDKRGESGWRYGL